MPEYQPQRVVIAGGGTAGWISAAALSRKFGDLLDITLVESEAIGTVGVGEATIPPMRVFHKLIGIDEQAFMRATSATFKLGISFENWGQIGERYLHSFGKTGRETWLAEFVHFWLRAQELGMAEGFGDYCLEHEAALQNRFATSPSSKVNFAYHLDATRYAAFLRELSEAAGVKRVEGKIDEVVLDSESGDINALKLDNGELIPGDLFIDCTGFRALLIEEALHAGYDNWQHWLPCDSATVVQTQLTGEPKPYTRSIAHEAGWRWQIPLQHRMGNGLVYASQFMDEASAKAKLLEDVEGAPCSEPRTLRFVTGCRKAQWKKNCVSLGLASGFIEPLESTSIHLVIMGITRLMQMFPFDGIRASTRDEFNAQSRLELEKIRDFIVLHYHQTQRNDTPFWDYCRNMDIPESLAHRMALFRDSAKAFQKDGELFRVDSWTQVMLGQGLVPERYHPSANIMQPEEMRTFFEGMRKQVVDAVAQLPQHGQFIQRYCASDHTR